ncbi:MAG: hypothetical protein ACRD38_08375 [Nitrososphaerales archaeon]
MKKGKLFALGIAIAVAIVAGFAVAVSTQNNQPDEPSVNPTGTGRNLTLNLEEKFGIETNPP